MQRKVDAAAPAERVGALQRLRIAAGGSRTLVIRLKSHVRRDLVRAMRQARVRRVAVMAITTIATGDMTRAFPVKITLKRRTGNGALARRARRFTPQGGSPDVLPGSSGAR